MAGNEMIFDSSILQNMAIHKIDKAKKAELSDFPSYLSNRLINYFKNKGIEKLYSHQREALDAIMEHKNTVITTGVDSGKSLCYQIPVLHQLQSDPQTRAIFLFPTKALTQDQKIKFTKFASEFLETKIGIGIYDGDTPSEKRRLIKKNANLLFTNPDMLHLGILPHHTNWSEFFQNLKFVVIDEVHIYRGIFGSHFANVIRRLKRIAEFYGAVPQFILTSATLSNVEEFSKKLIEEDVVVINKDGSPTGEKHYIIYNPPIVNKELGIRRSAMQETVHIAADLFEQKGQTLVFSESRRSVELILSYLRKNVDKGELVQGYRSGYLPSDRREIEKNFRLGKIRTVVSTNALELGIDIGGLDTVLINGYPGSIASTRQQFGRAGRSGKSSFCILVASSNLLDQYLVKHPDYIFKQNPEQALIDPDNPFILLHHLKCALFEKPFITGEQFGDLPAAVLNQYLQILQNYDLAYESNDKIFWKANSYPADEISLRTTGAGEFVLKCDDETIGIVDENSAYWLTHPQAIYIHKGETYLVTKLDIPNKIVVLEEQKNDYYTQAQSKTDFELIKLKKSESIVGGEKFYGQIKVTDIVKGFKRQKWHTNEILGYGELELPPQDTITYGYWFSISEDVIAKLTEKKLWNNSKNEYGSDWKSITEKVRKRDEHECQHCGVNEQEKAFDVHHKIPFKQFVSAKQANKMNNLITLCPSCHRQAERMFYVQSGLAGLAYLFRNIAPFFIMCDGKDIRVHSSQRIGLGTDGPGLVMHDSMPGGIGLSEKLYEMHYKLLWEAYTIVNGCECKSGCPACVGPVAENGAGAKKQVIEIIKYLMKKYK
ncbi:MAG: DEAD/DEAH box helicase [Candidatus Cloacimonetes bacterium]|nr:DEAD/DEAH box helicase [Candidatus Cloacimonadota bacterium]